MRIRTCCSLDFEVLNAAYDSLFDAVEMFQIGLLTNSLFAVGERWLNAAGTVATSRLAAKGFREGDRLLNHFGDHANEWSPPIKTAEEYLQRAFEFFRRPVGENILQKVRGGDVLRYDVLTNEFGVMAEDGYIRTFFRPKDGLQYFMRQKGI